MSQLIDKGEHLKNSLVSDLVCALLYREEGLPHTVMTETWPFRA